jgi:WD40 repeat protein/serine/threonine protein kinase
MGKSSPSVKAVFDRALEIESASDRKAYLDETCADAPELRQRVEALLDAYEDAGSFLERPAPEPVATADGPASEGPGAVIGPYKLIQTIGEGGMGSVFMAEQTHPVQRLVAVKAIRPGMDSRQVLARFEAERQALALMDHPNIAKVLDAGTTATGRPYFVMELVKGVPITRYCDECRLTPRERLELFVPVCQAVQHAHQKGIIHRDIKPSNVLIAPYDGRPVPKVIDFGVAKATGPRLTERTLYTEFGAVVGTLEYMSPEQAQLNQLDVDTRSDVYSLGVLLYELLTGMTPLDPERLKKAELLEVLRIIREEEPPRPSTRLRTTEVLPSIATNRGTEPNRLSGLVRGELDWIVMKCLAKDRNRRYETANSLAMDLRRYLNDEPVLACPPSASYRLRKLLRRHKLPVAVALLLLLMLVIMLALAINSNYRIDKALTERTRAFQDLEAEQDKTAQALKREHELKNKVSESLEQERLALYFHRIALAYREWEAARVARAEFLLDECPTYLRDWEWHYLKRQCHLDDLTFRGHTNIITGLAVTADTGLVVSRSAEGAVKLWNPADGRVTFEFNTPPGSSTIMSASGTRLAERDDEDVVVFDVKRGKLLRKIPVGKRNGHYGIQLSPDGARLLAGSGEEKDRIIREWNIEDGQRVLEVTPPSDPAPIAALAFRRDGQAIILGEDQHLVVRDATTGAEKTRWPCQPLPVRALCVDERRLATSDASGSLKLWDMESGKLLWERPVGLGNLYQMAAHPSGGLLATCHQDRTVRVWNLETGNEWLTIRGHTEPVTSLAFTNDGSMLVSGGLEETVKVWDTSALGDGTAPGTRRYRGPAPNALWALSSMSISRDGRWLAVCPVAGGLAIWDTVTAERNLVPGPVPTRAWVRRVALSPDGSRFASDGHPEFAVPIRSAKTGELLRLCVGHQDALADVAFSPDGRLLASSSHDGTIRLWDAQTGQALRTFRRHRAFKVAFGPDASRLASVAFGPDAALADLWDLNTGELIWKTDMQAEGDSLAFDRQGGRLAVAARDRSVGILDVKTGAERRVLPGHGANVTSVAFHPDGKRLAALAQDGSLVIWDVTSGREALTLPGQPISYTEICFSPDGRRLYRGDRECSVTVLDATPLAETRRANR